MFPHELMRQVSMSERGLGTACAYVILAAILVAGLMFVATSNVEAQYTSCLTELTSPTVFEVHGYELDLGVTVYCSYNPGQIYATGTAFDISQNMNLGMARAIITLGSGSAYTGDLYFSIPTSGQNNLVQFSVSVYSVQAGSYTGQYYGNLCYSNCILTSGSQTFTLSSPEPFQSYQPYQPQPYQPPGQTGTCPYPPWYDYSCSTFPPYPPLPYPIP